MVKASSQKAGKQPGPGRTGRPKLPLLEKLRRDALAALRRLEEVDSQFNERVGAADDDKARAKKLLKVAELRMAKAAEVNKAREKVRQARADVAAGTPGSKARLDAIKAKEEALTRQLREMPELGFTQEEWNDPEIRAMIPKETGRPQLEIEVRRVRAQAELDQAIEALRAEEKAAGVPHVDLATLKDPVKESAGQKIGRPKLDALGLLDRRYVAMQKKIERLKEEAANGVVPVRGKTPAAKVREAMQELAMIQQEIEQAESKLDAVGRLQREVKRMRDERRRCKLVMNERPDDCEAERQRRAYLRVEIDRKLAQITQLGGVDLEPEKPEAPDPMPAPVAAKPVTATAPRVTAPKAAAPKSEAPKASKPAPAPAPVVVPTKAAGAAAAADSPRARAELIRRRAEVQARLSEIDTKYATIIANYYETLDEETANELAEVTEKKRLQERSKVEGIELLAEGA